MANKLKKIAKLWWILALLLIVPSLIKARVPDPDTFFLAATGRFIVENGYVPTVNPFVIHENFNIIVQQGLFDVLIYGIYSTWGNPGLFIYLMTTFAISITLLYKYYSLFTTNTKLKGVIMVIAGILFACYNTARPTSISFPILLTLLYCMEQYRRTDKKRYLLPLPLLSLLEVNVHAAMWPMLFVMMLPYVFPYTLPKRGHIKENTKKWFIKNKWILLTATIMFACGFINPNGIQGMTYVMHSYGSATGGLKIGELLPPSTNTVMGFLIILTAAIFAIYLYKNKDLLGNSAHDNQNEFTRIYMTLGVLILAISHMRNMWYLILGAFPTVLLTLNNLSLQKPINTNKFRSIKIIAGALLTTILLIFAWFTNIGADYSANTNQDSEYAPIAAADYLDDADLNNIKLFTEFNNGAYMEWRGYEVYIDARPELFQENINGQEDIYTEFSKLTQGTLDYKLFLEKYQFTHLITSDDSRLNIFLKYNESYKIAVDGNGYTLYEYIQE